MVTYIWGNLQRANNDPTVIDQAIAEAVAAHNDDADSHLEAGQSLESHRAADIIDHRAQSVVNDKIRASARAYVAIVNPGAEGDFDTLNSAVEFAIESGGGTILIMPGTHYVTGTLYIPTTVNLKGLDSDTTTIIAGSAAGNVISFYAEATAGLDQSVIDNLAFSTSGGHALTVDLSRQTGRDALLFSRCIFKGGGRYMQATPNGIKFDSCDFYCSTVYALELSNRITMTDCRTYVAGVTTGRRFLTQDTSYGEVNEYVFKDCSFGSGTGWLGAYIDFSFTQIVQIVNSDLRQLGPVIIPEGESYIGGSVFVFTATGYLSFLSGNHRIIGNLFAGGTGARVRLQTDTERCVVGLNVIPGTVTNAGTGNVVANNTT